MTMDLYPFYDTFAYSFCQERDNINHQFRIFVNAYARAISMSGDCIEFSYMQIVFFPAWHFLRIVNHEANFPFWPTPKIYCFQIRNEIGFQGKIFIKESLAALQRVDAAFSTMEHFHASSSLEKQFEAAMNAITQHRQQLDEAKAKLNDRSWWHALLDRLRVSRELGELNNHYTRCDQLQDSIQAVREVIPLYRTDSAQLKTELQRFRASFHHAPSFEISTRGSIAVPEPLQALVKDYSWLKESPIEGSISNSSGPGGRTTILKRYNYNLDITGSHNVSALKVEIAEICRELTNHHTISGALYLICKSWNYARILSSFDADLVAGVQRSWVNEAVEASIRYVEANGGEHDRLVQDASRAHNNWQRKTPVPERIR